MSKLADKLREHQIYNEHGLMSKFGIKEHDVWVAYRAAGARACICSSTAVHSVSHKTDPGSAWYDHGSKTFVGKRQVSMPKAIEWASLKYAIKEWVPSPFGGGKIPKYVLTAAKTFLKEPELVATRQPD